MCDINQIEDLQHALRRFDELNDRRYGEKSLTEQELDDLLKGLYFVLDKLKDEIRAEVRGEKPQVADPESPLEQLKTKVRGIQALLASPGVEKTLDRETAGQFSEILDLFDIAKIAQIGAETAAIKYKHGG